MKGSLLAGLVGFAVNHASASSFSPARPPAIPLAVASPYMSTWLEVGSDGGNGGILPGYWPRFWAGAQPGSVVGADGSVTAWTGFITVDGTTYTWMGAAAVNGVTPTSVTQESFSYTSTRSTFIMNVDSKVSMNVSFINPITPTDLKRQSMIGTYLEVAVASIDGGSHAVELYADISAEWVSIYNTDVAQWNYTTNNGVSSHRVWRQKQSQFNADFADDGSHWGYWLWSTETSNSLTYQAGQDSVVRGNYLSNKSLPNTIDTNYRAISNDWPVFAYATNLGNVGKNPVSTLFTIMDAQQNAINFLGSGSSDVAVPSLWSSYFSSDLALVNYFYNDYGAASNEAGAFDTRVAAASIAAGGTDYLAITSLSARQAFGAVQLCGTPSKPYLFLKEISSDGNIQTVDVIFPSHPIFLWTSPILVKYLLDPLFENQEGGHFPQTYSIHDLGANYPNAVGHTDGGGEAMPLEECGNMLIMTLAYAQRAGDTEYLKEHYPILKQWTGYLIAEALYPANQLSTDDFQGPLANQTNLALKGIIGIEAMAVIANMTGNTADGANYTSIAHSYITEWETLATEPATAATLAHTTLAYNDSGSHGLLYNMYADRLLGLNLVPQKVYDMQSAFYPTVANTYGVPLDTRSVNTKTDWSMWAASIADKTTQTMFISKLFNWISATPTNRAFTDLYDTITGDFTSGPFVARPVVGGHFALLALEGAPANAVRSVHPAADKRHDHWFGIPFNA